MAMSLLAPPVFYHYTEIMQEKQEQMKAIGYIHYFWIGIPKKSQIIGRRELIFLYMVDVIYL